MSHQGEGFVFPVVLYDSMAAQYTADHVHGDPLVVFDLALIVGKETRGNFSSGCFAAVLDKGQEHDRLVDVGHPHLILDEINESFLFHISPQLGFQDYLAGIDPVRCVTRDYFKHKLLLF